MAVNDSHNVVFQLLKVSLGNAATIDYVPSEVNWREVRNLSAHQGVLGFCFDAFCQLPESVRPDRQIFLKWMGSTLLMEDRYQEYENAICRLSDVAQASGMRMMVLKGYGCSLNYPQPKFRPCGDIDIFLMDKAGKHSAELAERFESNLHERYGIRVESDNGHHSQFRFEKFLIENHSSILPLDHKSNAYLNDLLEDMAESCQCVRVGNSDIWLPSVKFNSIHLLRHMASDFASLRTSLRNVLDWSTFVVAQNVDWDFIQTVAHKSNMNHFLDAINGICVHFLGYPADMFPIAERDERMESRVLNTILNCTDTADAPHSHLSLRERLSYDLHKTRRLWNNRWKYRIVYNESLLESILWKARYRLKTER